MSFLILKPDYPHKGGATNALFSVKHGEILECPEEYDPDRGTFLIFETREHAQEFLDEQKAPAPGAAEQAKRAYRPYPLFRRVMSVGGANALQLFDRDVYGFLNREWQDVVMDANVMDIECGSLERLLESEKLHFKRRNVITILEDKIKRAPKAKPEPKEKVKGESKAAPGVTTKGFSKPKAVAEGEAKAEMEPFIQEADATPETPYTPPAVKDAKPSTFRQLLRAVSGIGKATTDDILAVYSDMESLQKAIKSRKKLPFRNDVAKLLRQNFSTDKIEKK